jgi:hypothetical protein
MFDRMEGRFRRREGELSLQLVEPSPARLMVSEAMLLMGAVVADLGCQEGFALPFRSQPPAELPSQAELDQLPEGPARDAAIKRCLVVGCREPSQWRTSALDCLPMCKPPHPSVVMPTWSLTVKSLPIWMLDPVE